VAAGVVGLIVVTVVDLARTTAARTPSLVVSALIFAVALGIMYRWKSKLATPVVLGIGAAIGTIALI
jgi:chromate transporter